MSKEKEKNLKTKKEDLKEELTDKEIKSSDHTKGSCSFKLEIGNDLDEKKDKTVEVDLLKKEIENKNTKILELLAEKENLTKRLAKEKQEFIKYSAGSFLTQIIPSIDMMEMALSTKNVSPEVENWLKGFEMIFNNFISSMEREGVKIITVKPGEYYNPKYDHAIDEQYSDDYKAGQIIKAHNQAFLLHDRLLRPASVIVAKSKSLSEEKLNDQDKKDIKNINSKDEEKNG